MIFYFSGTGNTRWAAHKVADALGDRLVDMAHEMRLHADDTEELVYRLEEGERVGFMYPVHGWRPPVLVRKFVSRLRLHDAEAAYTYVVCTAGDTVGEAEDIFEKDLEAVGVRVDSAISLLMPESYVGMPFMDVDTVEREQMKKKAADERLARFIADIERGAKGVCDLTIGRWPRINSRLIGSVFVNKLITDRPFRVDAGKCVGCGKCASVCPVEDIEMQKCAAEGGKVPHWKHNGRCLTCFACYHHCPKKAIEFGWRTKSKGQYYYEKNKNR